MASTFPGSVDVFKTIPTPTTTPTNKSDASDDTLSIRLQQHSDAVVSTQTFLLNKTFVFYAVDIGTTNSYFVTLAFPPASYVAGMVIAMLPANSNTSTSIINASGLGVVSILRNNGQPVQVGDIVANALCTMVYNGSAFLMLNPFSQVTDLGTVTSDQSIACSGASRVFVRLVTNTTFTLKLTLTGLTPGVPVLIQTDNSGGSLTFKIAATDQFGSAYAIFATNTNTGSIVDMVVTGTTNSLPIIYSGMSGLISASRVPTLILMQA